MVTLSNAEKALKTFYLDVVTDQLNTKINPFLAKMEKTASNVYGNEIRKRVSYALNGGISACDEGGDLPIAAAPNYQEFVAKLKNLYGTLEISDKAIRATENNSGAFVSLLEAEVESLLTAAKFHFGRMLMGLETGVLAKVVSFTGNYITVDSVRNFMEGMIIDVIDDGTNVKKLSSRRITEVDRTNTRIKIDGSALGTGAIAEDNCVCYAGQLLPRTNRTRKHFRHVHKFVRFEPRCQQMDQSLQNHLGRNFRRNYTKGNGRNFRYGNDRRGFAHLLSRCA